MAAKIKSGDTVIVLTGRDKGKTGEVIKMMPDDNKALVRGRKHGASSPAPDPDAGRRDRR